MAFSDKDIYKKNGKTNFREKNLIKELKDALQKKLDKEPSFKFKAATDYQSLKELHETYCIDDVSFEENKSENLEDAHKRFRDSAAKTIEPEEEEPEYEEEDAVTPEEPFTESNPEIRDYVIDGQDDYGGNFDFAEPTNDQEAFNFEDRSVNDKTTPEGEKANPSSGSSPSSKPKREKPQPINPSYDEMSAKSRNKNTKAFAHYITEAVAAVSKQGFIYFTTRNITDTKLAEYEMSGEYDLEKEVVLENNVRVTIKQFLQIQRQVAEANSALTEQEKADLKSVVADVMQEKGFTPTPMQNLGIVGLGIGVRLFSVGIQINASCKSVLEQIRVDKPIAKQSYQAPQHEQETERAREAAREAAKTKAERMQQDDAEGDLEALTTPFNEDDILTESGIDTKE